MVIVMMVIMMVMNMVSVVVVTASNNVDIFFDPQVLLHGNLTALKSAATAVGQGGSSQRK